MQVKNLLLLGFVAFVLTACGDKQIMVVSPEESATLGFNVEGESVLENPPADKARIYILRESSFVGSAGSYPIYYLYNSPNTYKDEEGKFRIKDEVLDEVLESIAKKSQSNFMGRLFNGGKLWQDFEADKPLLFRVSLDKNFFNTPIWGPFVKEWNAFYLVFTPQLGKIYCLEPIKHIFARRYSSKVIFLDRQACEALFRE